MAWKAGVRTPSVITEIGTIHNPYFDNLKVEVALSGDSQIPFVFKGDYPPTGYFYTDLRPRKERTDPFPVIGVAAPMRLKLFPPEYAKHRELPGGRRK